jgi:RNA 3'-terminal phosphate cyclase (ATP)
MMVIDGSQGEGGGQILRTALGLSLVTGVPFRIVRIRAGRKKPGLLRQHLTAVEAAAQVGRAQVAGAALGSAQLTFTPSAVVAGEYHFSVGTAGSTTLVLQTVLPALLTAGARSVLTLEGGTHNPFAPPFDFLERVFFPLIRRMGPVVEADLVRPGFYPAGGGKFTVTIEPAEGLRGFELLERGDVVRRRAVATVSALPRDVGERELAVVKQRLGWPTETLALDEVADPRGPGNVLSLVLECAHAIEMVTAFGQRGVRAEAVAAEAVEAAERYLAAGVPVGEHLADQLLVPLALAGQGRFTTLTPTSHTRTNMEVIQRFLGVALTCEHVGDDQWLIAAGGA